MAMFDPNRQPDWPTGESAGAALIRSRDWSASSLGPVARWPQSLRTLVDICLGHPLPCVAICGPDRLLIYNDPCAGLLGDAHPSAFGDPAASGFPEALSDVGPIHERLAAGAAVVFHGRPWVFRRHGVLFTEHYDVYFTPVPDECAAFPHTLAMILDVPAGGATLSSQSASITVTAADALWILDTGRMRLDYASPALDRLLGASRAMLQADFRRWLDLVHPDDRPIAEEHQARAAAGEALVAQYRITRPGDGASVVVRHTSVSLPDGGGGAGRVAGLVQDVTAVEGAQAALREEMERYRTLADGIPPLVWRSSDEGLWTWAGPQWLAFTGQTQLQAQGWGWLDVVHPDDRQSTMQAWHQARPHGMLDASFRLRRASDGSWRWHQTRSLPRRAEPKPGEPEGPILEWLGSSTDIHDLKSLQTRQAAMIADLEHRTASLKGVIRSLGGAVQLEDTAS